MNAINSSCKTGKIVITEHAMERLIERVRTCSNYRSWKHMVKTARYEGIPLQHMSDEQYSYCKKHGLLKRLNNSTQIRYLDGFFFIFKGSKGHARTLITVISMDDEDDEDEDVDSLIDDLLLEQREQM